MWFGSKPLCVHLAAKGVSVATRESPLTDGGPQCRRLVAVVELVCDETARLMPPQLLVMAAMAQQLLVSALLDDLAGIEHHEPVHARDRREPMRDRDDGLALHQVEELLLDRELDLAVERRRRLVEDENRRVLQNHARKRDALPLAPRQLHAALADVRAVTRSTVPILERDDELVRLRLAGRGDDLAFGGR